MSLPEVDVEVLWQLLHEQGGRFLIEELADLALGVRSPEAVRAMEQALRTDGVRFRDRKGMFEPRSPQAVDDTLLQRQVIEDRAVRREAAIQAARIALSGGSEMQWEEHADIFRPLEEFAIHRDSASVEVRDAADQLLRDLSRSKGGPWLAAVRALTALGRFSEDDNLLLIAHRIPQTFPDDVLAEVQALASGPDFATDPGRLDLTGNLTIAIDDVDTDEVDDALSAVELPGGGWRVDVHIADASAWVPEGGAVDAEARRRGATLYLPDRRVPMLPDSLAYDRVSLKEGAKRAALTFRIELDRQGRVERFEPRLSTISVDCQMPYEEVDCLLEARSDTALAKTLRALYRLADLLCAARVRRGALEVQPPEVKVKLLPSGAVRVTPLERFSPARRLVSEWMIQSGRLAATWGAEQGVAMVFRSQDAPEDPPEMPPESMVDPVAFHSIVRKLRKASVSTSPAPHWGLGVEAYSQVTSPIRRYADLVMHRQIKQALTAPAGSWEPFDPDAERAILHTVAAAEQAVDLLRSIERETNRYFVLKHLQSHVGEPMAAVVITERDRGRFLVSIGEVAIQATVALRGAPQPRDVRSVQVVSVSARADRLQLEEVGQPEGATESGD